MTYSYSTNQENYHGDFETREAALAEAYALYPGVPVWTGENSKKEAADFIDVSDLFENAQCQAEDECGEAAEDWLPVHFKKELERKAELREIIGKFMQEHWPVNFWAVEAVQEHQPQDGTRVSTE